MREYRRIGLIRQRTTFDRLRSHNNSKKVIRGLKKVETHIISRIDEASRRLVKLNTDQQLTDLALVDHDSNILLEAK
jgi:hypothetical protein